MNPLYVLSELVIFDYLMLVVRIAQIRPCIRSSYRWKCTYLGLFKNAEKYSSKVAAFGSDF